MPKKLSRSKIKFMQRLYEDGISVKEISRKAKISYSTAYGYTMAKERGFESLHEYRKHIAKERGFSSMYEYRKHIAKERGFSSMYEYREYLAKRRGFKSDSEYREYLVKEKGFESLLEYKKHLAIERGFPSLTEYGRHLAKERGFPSLTEYGRHLAKERQKRNINQMLSFLILSRLNYMGHTQRWLAKQLELSDGAVHNYISGKYTPRKTLQEKLFKTLNLPYKTLDDILDNN